MCVCVCVCVHACRRTCVCACVHTCMHACVHVCVVIKGRGAGTSYDVTNNGRDVSGGRPVAVT